MAAIAPAERRKIALPLGLGAGAGVGLTAALFALAPLLSVGAIGVTYLLLASPELGLIVILLARPMLDLVQQGIGLPGFGEALDPSAILALIVILAAAVYVLVRRINLWAIPLVAPFAWLLAVATTSVLISDSPATSVAAVTRLAGQLAVYVLTYLVVRNRRQVEHITAALMAAAVLPVLWGFYEIATGNAKYLHPNLAAGISHPRLAGPFGEGLTLGSFLIIPLVLAVCFLLESRRRDLTLAYTVLLGLLLIALYMTLARGPWVAFALALGVLGVVRYRALLAFAPVALVLAAVLVPGILLRWSPVVESPESTTAGGRVERWEGAWAVFVDNPALGAGFGVGDLEAGKIAAGRDSPAHSDYLRILADCGIAGFIAYMWLLLATGITAIRLYPRLNSPFYRTITLAFIASWAAFMLLRATGNILTLQVIQYYFWSFAAVVMALPACETNEESVIERQPVGGQADAHGLAPA